MKYYLKKNSHRILKSFFILLFSAGILFGLWWFIDTRGEVITLNDEQSDNTQQGFVSLESRVLNFGSVNWGDPSSVNRQSFDALAGFNRTDYDAWIANLTCHIEPGTGCNEDLFKDFTKWFNIVGVGEINEDTKKSSVTAKSLVDSNVQFFGMLASAEKSDNCGVVALPARFRSESGTYTQAAMPIVLCGINGAETLSVDLAEKITSASRVLPVWVYALDDTSASQTEIELHYRSYIDAGADLVMGVSKAGLGKAERYNDKLIIYSLGGFMGANQQSSPAGVSALVGVTVSAEKDDNLLAWTEIAKTCSGYNDLCLEAGQSRSLSRPDYKYTYSLQGVSTISPSNPVPANQLQSSDIASYMQWVKATEPTESTEGEVLGF